MNKNTFSTTLLIAVASFSLSACEGEKFDTGAVSESVNVAMSKPITGPEIIVYKSPSCGCCQSWVDYVENAGFSISAINHDDMDAVKAQHGLTDPALKSCHTAIVDGYVIEGHVPVSDIERLLAQRPDIVGLTAPGMPIMSPGMGSETPKDYDVLAFDKNGKSTIFSSY